MTKINESTIKEFAIELLEKQGYQYIYALFIAPNLSASNKALQAGNKKSQGIFR